MDHSAGVDVVLGTDFMIPAGARLDLFHGTARLPGKLCRPSLRTTRDTGLTSLDDPPKTCVYQGTSGESSGCRGSTRR
ncbi:Eukaryotic/viral aspartic protease [Phytophthora megakarya]|uniref:Eukaryotic/viral aspartic protease n=1 Tax=Phytophthora megakarya TaxID=4795 RepID=A0A225UBE7_9STRA|nr:Eukaryotic/viral aspartic protease [Phytophthora megakarya]